MGPAVLWAAVLFYLSSLRFDQGPPSLPLNDKVLHGLLYLILGGALAWARMILERRGHLAFILAGLLYGVSDEIHQYFVPGRTPSVQDWLADAVGLAVGYLLVTRLLAGWLGVDAADAHPGHPG